MKTIESWFARCLCVSVIGLYVVSFFLPAAGGLRGWHAFLVGCVWFFASLPEMIKGEFTPFMLLGLSWLANWTLWLGITFVANRQWLEGGLTGILALLLGLTCLLRPLPIAEGYYLWLSSMALLAAGGMIGWIVFDLRTEQPPPTSE